MSKAIEVTEDDVPKIAQAMMQWFYSQGIRPTDSLKIMSFVTGVIIADLVRDKECKNFDWWGWFGKRVDLSMDIAGKIKDGK